MIRARWFCLLLLPLPMASCGFAAAQTGNASNGQAIYTSWCVGCHNANPRHDVHGVLNGAGNANFILNEWNIVPSMQFLVQGALPDPAQAAADVAAYLATLTSGGGPGSLQLPGSLAFGTQNVGTQSAPTPVLVSNSGATAVAISSFTGNDPSEFPITSSSCMGSLDPGASCVFNVAFNPNSLGLRVATITIASTGVGSPQTIALSGTGAQATGGSPTVQAVEYYYAAWNFYFETAFPSEIAALDGGAFGGVWRRTGQTFNVWPQTNPAAAPTCRFFSTAFTPKSSHFYTPFAAECATLKTEPVWQYEDIAFYIQLADVNGLCAAGTMPLYRLYNNGMGGAPNHRYTTDPTIFNQMVAAGWLFEGNGNTKVFACVPL